MSTSGGDNRSSSLRRAASQPFLDGMEARFMERCEVGLRLSETMLQRAVCFFKDSKLLLLANIDSIGSGTVEEAERLWNACVFYAVKRLSSATCVGEGPVEGTAAGFTLMQLLQVTDVSVMDLFKELPQFLVKAAPTLQALYGDSWEKLLQVKEVQANFVHMKVLSNYYKRVYKELFLVSECSSGGLNGSPVEVKEGFPPQMQLGWMLFLALRMHVLNQFPDLVTCTNGLLAIIVILMLHMPPQLRKFCVEDTSKFAKRSPKGVNLVASFCNMYHACEKDVCCMVDKANSMIRDLYNKKPSDASISCHSKQIAGIDTDGLLYFEGLMESGQIMSNISIVEKDYEEAYQSLGELDERMFINGEVSLMGSVSCGSPDISASKRKYDTMSSPVRGSAVSTATCLPSQNGSPCSSPVKIGGFPIDNSSKIAPPTPVSITMTTAKWLRDVITPLPAEPCLELQLFFRSCDRDISSDVRNRAQVLLESIFPSNGLGSWRRVEGNGQEDSVWAEQRRLEALKLYYRVVGAMCRSEAQRLQNSNLTSLLSNERFHRCMIACSAELVLATHKTVTMTFPAVLEPAGITAFDLSKVIEYFVRHEDTLPRELKRHLNSIEEKLLESMAWEKGSSMYTSLIFARPNLTAEINRLCLLAEPMPSLDNLSSQEGPTIATTQHLVGGSQNSSDSFRLLLISSFSQSDVFYCSYQVGSTFFNSPVKERLSAFSAFSSPLRNRLRAPLQSAFASPQRPSPVGGGETCAETVINVFFQKVLILAAVRIRNLCERLGQPQPLVERVYRVFQHTLHRETSLFFNRHIDQLILCTIYGVCKVSKATVTFRDIIHQYRMQPQCKLHVFRNVFIDLPPWRRAGDPSVMDIACAALNGLKMGDRTLTVRRASASFTGFSGQPKPDLANVLVQAQQQIALQKLALSASGANAMGLGSMGMSVPGMLSGLGASMMPNMLSGIDGVPFMEVPTKVVCLSQVHYHHMLVYE
ncbi:unnamed protein product [Sphagnum jensenii]|uniref:Retinoblastoma-related protein n=1 Tax=Sphagnum jensenii TaxID=128206 RepID=A0ABP0ZYB6_9BRYO